MKNFIKIVILVSLIEGVSFATSKKVTKSKSFSKVIYQSVVKAGGGS